VKLRMWLLVAATAALVQPAGAQAFRQSWWWWVEKYPAWSGSSPYNDGSNTQARHACVTLGVSEDDPKHLACGQGASAQRAWSASARSPEPGRLTAPDPQPGSRASQVPCCQELR